MRRNSARRWGSLHSDLFPGDKNASEPYLGHRPNLTVRDTPEGGAAETLQLRKGRPESRNWVPNPTGKGLSRALASIDRRSEHMDQKKRKYCLGTSHGYTVLPGHTKRPYCPPYLAGVWQSLLRCRSVKRLLPLYSRDIAIWNQPRLR